MQSHFLSQLQLSLIDMARTQRTLIQCMQIVQSQQSCHTHQREVTRLFNAPLSLLQSFVSERVEESLYREQGCQCRVNRGGLCIVYTARSKTELSLNQKKERPLRDFDPWPMRQVSAVQLTAGLVFEPKCLVVELLFPFPFSVPKTEKNRRCPGRYREIPAGKYSFYFSLGIGKVLECCHVSNFMKTKSISKDTYS